MSDRSSLRVLLLIALALPIAGCGSTSTGLTSNAGSIDSVYLVPGSQSVAAVNQTAQFIAIGKGTAGAAQNLTSQVTWSSSDGTVATVNAAGLATALKTGKTTISASVKNPDGTVVSADGALAVTGITSEPLLSLAILPASQTVNSQFQTGQFLALGTFLSAASGSICKSAGFVQDCTKYVTWISSEPVVGSISSTGLVTGGIQAGTTAITAIGTNPDGTLVTATGTFTENATGAEPSSSSVSISLLGSNYTAGSVTGYLYDPVKQVTTGPQIFNCMTDINGRLTAGCLATLPIGSYIQLTAKTAGTNFNGWTTNCDTTPNTPNTTATCTIQTIYQTVGVGAMFN